jgi:chaperone required for assembly of F1-ATPase
MTGWAPRRFWTDAEAGPCDGGFTVRLDGRPLRTPAKAAMVLPTSALAEAVAGEWRAQDREVRPLTMPCTRAANVAIDRVAPQFAEVAAGIAAYGGSDLLCYRAEVPQALAARQAAAWDPLLAWAAGTLAAPLAVHAGVVPRPQPADSLARLAAGVTALDPFRLTALADLVALSGSLVIGLAVLRRHVAPEAAWQASRIDEDWQVEHWGDDAESAAADQRRHGDFLQAARLLALLDAA